MWPFVNVNARDSKRGRVAFLAGEWLVLGLLLFGTARAGISRVPCSGTKMLAGATEPQQTSPGQRRNPLDAARRSINSALNRPTPLESDLVVDDPVTPRNVDDPEDLLSGRLTPMSLLTRSIEMGARTRSRVAGAFSAQKPVADDDGDDGEVLTAPTEATLTAPKEATGPPQELWLTLGDAVDDEDELGATTTSGAMKSCVSSPADMSSIVEDSPTVHRTASQPTQPLSRAEQMRQKTMERAAAAKAAARAQLTPRRTKALASEADAAPAASSKMSRLKKSLPGRKAKAQIGNEHGHITVALGPATPLARVSEGQPEPEAARGAGVSMLNVAVA